MMASAIDYQTQDSHPRQRVNTTEIVVLGLVMFAATIDLARKISVVGISGLGAESLVCAGLIWAVWLSRPVLSNSVLRPLLPLILFNLDAAGSRFWSSTGIDGTQIQIIGLGFLGMMFVCAREAADDPEFTGRLQKMILYASVVAVLLSFRESYINGAEEEGDLISRRPFALYAMPVVAVALAGWRGGTTRKTASLCLIWALITTAAVGFTQSRTALVACLLLFPIAIALRLTKKSVLASVILTAAVGAAFLFLIFTVPALYDRFFKNDAAIKVGGVAINASGRTKIWGLLWDNIGDDWLFGKGVATSVLMVRTRYAAAGQPHNDFLRFYYDQGIVGIGLFAGFLITFFARAFRDLKRSIQYQTGEYRIHMAAIMGFVAVLISMATDNTYVYAFAMIPMGALIGASIGAGSRLDRPNAPDADWGHTP
jgi:O-antigen ligase